ncbi:MAG: DNA polymerase III subunit chi [Acidiferrobacterales bacterium]|jgi:DNA polymerase-3 subunit chi|nr:DNA polymerase III subunit chi [Acidiferrobacterales bacterium]
MTQVDFYLLGDNGDDNRIRLACRLIDKAFRLRRRIYVYTGSEAEAAQLDQLLWTFNPGSFVPHELNSGQEAPETPVVIGHQEPPGEFADVLVSLASDVPSFFSRFERVAEVVGGSEAEKEQARERFRFYRDRGYELETHTL